MKTNYEANYEAEVLSTERGLPVSGGNGWGDWGARKSYYHE